MGTKKLAILFLFSIILAFSAGYFSSNLIENRMIIESDEMFKYITRAFDEYYYYDLDNDDVYDAFIKSMYAVVDSYADAKGDPYTKIVSYSDNLGTSDVESYVGLGINYQFEDLNIRVNQINAQSDLYMNVFPNDLIIGVAGEDDEPDIMFSDMKSVNDVIDFLDKDLGDTLTLIVENPIGDVNEIPFEYKELLIPSAYTVDLDNEDVAYIKIRQFIGYEQGVNDGTNYIFNNVLNSLEESVLIDDTKTLIIDLRDNEGGAFSTINNKGTTLNPGITQLLLVNDLSKPLFSMVDKDNVVTNYYGGLTSAKTYDIKVLVNENTASASEVLAASLMMSGYQLYGHSTYGNGVYQNSIYLNDIRNVRYYLTYTEGAWNYDTDKNVMTDPLTVETIEQQGVFTIDCPVFKHILTYDTIDKSLSAYQSFLNVYFNLDEGSKIRTDGYFDEATRNWIIQYQTENELELTGDIDLATARMIYSDYETEIQDITMDYQLQSLLEMIGTNNG